MRRILIILLTLALLCPLTLSAGADGSRESLDVHGHDGPDHDHEPPDHDHDVMDDYDYMDDDHDADPEH